MSELENHNFMIVYMLLYLNTIVEKCTRTSSFSIFSIVYDSICSWSIFTSRHYLSLTKFYPCQTYLNLTSSRDSTMLPCICLLILLTSHSFQCIPWFMSRKTEKIVLKNITKQRFFKNTVLKNINPEVWQDPIWYIIHWASMLSML